MRYKVEFDSETARWLVIDTGLANQRMGIHQSKLAALRQAVIEEKRWLTYDPLCSGIPPWEAPAPAEARKPAAKLPRRAGSTWWCRRPGAPLPATLADGTR